MVRTVKAVLDLDNKQFVAEAKVSKEELSGIDRKVDDVDRSLKKLPPDAAKAAAAMKLLGDETGKAKLQLDNMGKGSTALGQLEQRLASARAEVRRLADEFNRTGDSGTLVKLFNTDRQVRDLERLKKRLTSTLGEAGAEGGQAMAKGVGSSFELAMPELMPVLITALVLAAPFIAGAINAAVVSGVGLGGLALGIVGQIHDPRVKAAFAELGHGLGNELSRDTASFADPLVHAAGILGADLRSALGSIDFKTLSGDVAPLAAALGGLVRSIMPGFNAALRAAQPLLDQLDRNLPEIGAAIGFMFDQMSKGTGNLGALKLLLGMIFGTIEAVGVLVRVLSDLFDIAMKSADGVAMLAREFAKLTGGSGVVRFLDSIVGGLDEITGRTPHVTWMGKALHDMGGSAEYTAENMSKLAGSIGSMTTASDLAAKAAGYLFDKTMNLDQATLSWHRSLLDLSDTLKKNHDDLRLTTAAGIENRQAILGAVQANMQQYQALVAAGDTAQDAARQYDLNTQALERQLRQAGLTKGQIDDLIGRYRSIPDTVNTKFQMDGLTDAINRLDTLLRRINGLPYSKEVRINVIAAIGFGAAEHRAGGGDVKAGRAYIVGERQPEYFTPAVDGHIWPSAAAWDGARMAAPSGGGPSTLQLAATFVLPSGEVTHRQLITYALNTGRTPAQLFPSSAR